MEDAIIRQNFKEMFHSSLGANGFDLICKTAQYKSHKNRQSGQTKHNSSILIAACWGNTKLPAFC